MSEHQPLPTPIKTLVALYKKHNNSCLDINHLVCKTCNKWLSEPIFLMKGGNNVCGRCAISAGEDCIRNVSLEQLLMGFKYPCKFNVNGCNVFYTLAENHEEVCHYNMYCYCKRFVVNVEELIKHLKNKHQAVVLEFTKPTASMSVHPNTDGHVNIKPVYLQIGETRLIVLVSLKSTDFVKKLNVSVYNVGSIPRDIKCTIKVFFDDTDYIKHGKVSNKLWDHTGMMTISLPSLDQEDCPDFMLKIYFDNYHDFEVSERNFESMIKEYECPVCLETIIEHCYQCSNGHNVCETCKLSISICPICRLKFNSFRSNIKNLTGHIQRLCKYAANGCFVHNHMGAIIEHEKACPVKLTACDVCKDRQFDTAGLLNHMLLEHNLQTVQKSPMVVKPGYIAYKDVLLELNFEIKQKNISYDTFQSYRYYSIVANWYLRLINGPTDHMDYTLEIELAGKKHTLHGKVQEDDKLESVCFPNMTVVPVTIKLAFQN